MTYAFGYVVIAFVTLVVYDYRRYPPDEDDRMFAPIYAALWPLGWAFSAYLTLRTPVSNFYWRNHQSRVIRRCQRAIDELAPEYRARLLRDVLPAWERQAQRQRMRRWQEWLTSARERLETETP